MEEVVGVALVTRFEDLQAWQAARRLAALVQRLVRERSFRRDRNLSDQLRRAATSTVTNIAEGFGSGSHLEFQRFLRYAIRSAVEVQSCLYLAVDAAIIADDDFQRAYDAAECVKSLCSALVRRLAARSPRPRVTKAGGVSEPSATWIANQRRIDCGRAATPNLQCVSTSARQHVSTSARPHVHTSARGGAGD